MTESTGSEAQRLLALELPENDAEAATVRDYLISLLAIAWRGEDSHPWGNSGWHNDLHVPMMRAGMITGKLEDDYYVLEIDSAKADRLILAAIDSLRSEAPAAPSVVTVTTGDGREHRYEAADYALDARALHVLAEKGKEESAFATFPHGQWAHAEIDGRRATGPAPRPERAQALERLLSSVRAALFASDLSDSDRIAAVKAAHDRHCAGFPATSSS